VLLTLQLQEPGVARQSVMAAVEGGDVGGDHLMLRAGECAIREM
jgi:hypothetical protein